MPSNFLQHDNILGSVDLDEVYITEPELLERYVGNHLFGCGYNDYGELGNGTITHYSSPIQIGSLTDWKQVSLGYSDAAAIKTDGTLWAWGYNYIGQLGNGTRTHYSSPIQIGSLTNWKQISHAKAIKTDGTLWSWGSNSYGQLGNGTVTPYSSPIQVGSLTNWKQISCSYYHTLAIKTDGTLWAWGRNDYGQMGNGTITPYSSPIQIGSLTNWKQISCNTWGNTLAIKTDGTLWAWGRNNYGALGNGTVTPYSSPIQIGSLTNWKQVHSKVQYTLAIKTDGTLWAWGLNTYGQLGMGTESTKYSSPVQVGALTNWKQVSGGEGYNSNFSAAVKTDGTLWAWGDNYYGIVGNNTNQNRYSSPIQVGSLTNWKQVACGYQHFIAITYKEIT